MILAIISGIFVLGPLALILFHSMGIKFGEHGTRYVRSLMALLVSSILLIIAFFINITLIVASSKASQIKMPSTIDDITELIWLGYDITVFWGLIVVIAIAVISFSLYSLGQRLYSTFLSQPGNASRIAVLETNSTPQSRFDYLENPAAATVDLVKFAGFVGLWILAIYTDVSLVSQKFQMESSSIFQNEDSQVILKHFAQSLKIGYALAYPVLCIAFDHSLHTFLIAGRKVHYIAIALNRHLNMLRERRRFQRALAWRNFLRMLRLVKSSNNIAPEEQWKTLPLSKYEANNERAEVVRLATLELENGNSLTNPGPTHTVALVFQNARSDQSSNGSYDLENTSADSDYTPDEPIAAAPSSTNGSANHGATAPAGSRSSSLWARFRRRSSNENNGEVATPPSNGSSTNGSTIIPPVRSRKALWSRLRRRPTQQNNVPQEH